MLPPLTGASKNVGEAVSARRKQAKKRSLRAVNEHFEPVFNAAMTTQAVFRGALKPLPMKDRVPMVFIRYGQIDVLDGAFVVIDKNGVRKHIPVGSVACIMLEPGTRISHAAVNLAATVGTLLVWVGESGVRLYSSGQPGGARADRLLYQARLALDDELRLKVVRKMYEVRFGEPAPARRSVEQLRGIEGARVRGTYKLLAQEHKVNWQSRNYDRQRGTSKNVGEAVSARQKPAKKRSLRRVNEHFEPVFNAAMTTQVVFRGAQQWEAAGIPNRCLSAATACLYGITEAAVLAAGYAPAVGFIHTGKPLSFVYDIADLYKFETVVPLAFRIAAKAPAEPEREVRLACRDLFRSDKLLGRIIPLIEEVLAAGGIHPPEAPPESVPPAIPNPDSPGDAGHRSR